MTVNGPDYRSHNMLPSPRGRELREISGNAEDIAQRGRDMVNLGDRMQRAANTLNHIASGTVGKGLSIDKMRDEAEAVYSDLKTAGIRYSPSGAVIRDYGVTLGEVQQPVRSLVEDCESRWATVRTRSLALEEAEQAREDTASLQSSFDLAVDAWEDEARNYDGYYDTWDAAYNAAVNGLEDANSSGVSDSLLDNALPVLDAISVVLSIAGVVLAVVACILGGPFVLAAALVGLAALGVTLLRAAGGRADGSDIMWSAIGVFPFGKAFGTIKGIAGASGFLGKLGAAGSGGLGMLTDIVGLGGTTSRGLVTSLLSRGSAAEVFHAGGQVLNQNGSRVLRQWFGDTGGPSVMHRLLQGFDGATGAHFADAASGLSAKAQNNLAQFLGGPQGSHAVANLMNNPGGSVDQVLNFVDGLGKTAGGAAHDLGWI